MATPVQPNEAPHEGTAVSFQQNQLLLDCDALEKALEENEERGRNINLEIKKYKDIQETIRIQLLELKARNSIARNKQLVREESPFSMSNDIVKNGPVIEKMDISVPSSMEQHVSIDSASLSKEKGKSRMDNVEVQQSSPPSQVNKPVKPDELRIQKRSPFLTAPNQQPNARRSKKKATGANSLSKRQVSSNKTVKPLVPSLKRVREIAESSGKKKKMIQIEHGNRLIDAVIDKPFSKRYVLEEILGSEIQSDSSVKETKRQRKAKEKEEIISNEERKLIGLDDPPYPGHCIQGCKKLTRTAHRAVVEFLNNSSTSLKEMRLTLLNLKEASVEQSGRLTIEQEEFTKALIRRIMQQIESYMTLSDEAYARLLRKQPPVDVTASLPDQYYGDIITLDFSIPDLSHHQLYKVIRHFDSITNMRIKRKAQQFLLTSGRTSVQQILRTCNPAIRDDADATLSGDETDYARRIKLLKREKLEQRKAPNEKNENSKISKREKRKATQELKKEMLVVNRQVADGMAEEIDQLADRIATDMYLCKKTRLDSRSSANKPVCLNIDLPASSSAPRLEEFVNTWKPKLRPKAVSAQQFTSPSSSVTVVKPVRVAMKDINTIFTKAKSRAVDVPVIIDDNRTSKPTIDDTRESNEDTSLKSQENPMQCQPYKSTLNSLGLSRTAPLPEPKSASLCSAESSSDVCKVKNCNFTHLRDDL